MSIIQNFNNGSRFAVRYDRWAAGRVVQIVSGEHKDACLLIIISIGDGLGQEESKKARNKWGIKWMGGELVADLDCADDVAFLKNTLEGTQRLTSRVDEEVKWLVCA